MYLVLYLHALRVRFVTDGRTALQFASAQRNRSMMKLLTKHGAAYQAETSDGPTPPLHLVLGTKTECRELVKLLVDYIVEKCVYSFVSAFFNAPYYLHAGTTQS